MLHLARKCGQTIVIDNRIEVTVVEIRGSTVKLGITYPPESTILRKEVHERISQANQQASYASVEDVSLLVTTNKDNHS
jgi:carbon storage regulator